MARLHFKTIENIRDFTGIRRRDASVINESACIRSSHLADLSDEEMELLYKEMNVRTVIDLRTTMEIREKPDRIPEGVAYYHVPLIDESMMGITHEEETDMTEKIREIPEMEQMYRELMKSDFTENGLREVFRIIRERTAVGTVLWHCTEGKDRCGIVSALYLTSAGVDFKAVLKDYMMTKRTAGPKACKYFWMILLFRHDRKLARAVSLAYDVKPKYLKAAFEEIENKYGSVENFLKLIGAENL